MEKFLYKKAVGVTALSASFSDFQYRKHCHEEYAVGVTLRGIQQYNMDGSLQTSYPGGIMLFNPEQVHDGMSQGKAGIDYVMLYIGTKLVSELTGSKEHIRFPFPIVYNGKLQQRILNLTDAIFSDKEDVLCSEMLLALADGFTQTATDNVFGNNNDLMNRAKEMIHYSLDKVLRLDDICREVDMSKYQFIRMFKTSTGIPPYQFFLNCKVEKAKQLIEESKDIYMAVAECGFADLTHLNRHFKSRYGVTAFEYISAIS